MSQLLFPTPDEPAPPVAVVQEHQEGGEHLPTEPITNEDKILRLVISASIGLLLGVLEAVIISNSMVEIALTKAFSIVFGISLLLLAAVLGWRIWVSHEGSPISKFILLGLALLVAVCGILCFVVEAPEVAKKSAGAKAPYFVFIGMALAFALTFAFSEFINLGLCNLCCPRTFATHPPFISRVQLYLVLGSGLLLGLILGIIFGSMNVEGDWSAGHTRLVKMLLYGLIPGSLIGIAMGLINEFLRDRLPSSAYQPLPVESRSAPSERSLPSGYDDI